jgi:hypothetical protein
MLAKTSKYFDVQKQNKKYGSGAPNLNKKYLDKVSMQIIFTIHEH